MLENPNWTAISVESAQVSARPEGGPWTLDGVVDFGKRAIPFQDAKSSNGVTNWEDCTGDVSTRPPGCREPGATLGVGLQNL